jgi:hypothetical protein
MKATTALLFRKMYGSSCRTHVKLCCGHGTPRAKAHRKIQGIAGSGLSIIVQAMVQTDGSESAGIGRATTRNHASGRAELTVDYLAQGTGHDLTLKLKVEKSVEDSHLAQSTDIPASPRKVLEQGLAALEHDQCDAIDAVVSAAKAATPQRICCLAHGGGICRAGLADTRTGVDAH